MTRVPLFFVSRRDYAHLREISADGNTMPASYREFVNGFRERVSREKNQGRTPVKVKVKVATLLAWCDSRGCVVDAKARATYAATHIGLSK